MRNTGSWMDLQMRHPDIKLGLQDIGKIRMGCYWTAQRLAKAGLIPKMWNSIRHETTIFNIPRLYRTVTIDQSTNNQALNQGRNIMVGKLLGGESKETRSLLAQSRDRYSPYMKELETGRFMNGIRVVRTLILDRIKSRQGKPIRKALVRSYMESAELPLLENIRKIHSACKSRPGISSSVLALVFQVYTIEQLKDFGFEFSSNQHAPTSKTKVSDETKAKVSDILYEFSNSSSSTISLGTAGNGYQEIRYLTKPKRDIYYVLKEKNPGIQLSLRNENASLEQIMRLRVATEEFQVHRRLALEQRKNFKNQIAGLSGGGPIETTRDFYQKSQISDLCFCVLSKSGDQIQRRYYNYLSENLSHDSLYVINCLKDLLYRPEFQEFEEVNLWSDSGPHFKNADYLYSVCLELPQIFPSKKFKLNYFMENHGKSKVDGHFGVLSRWFKEIERSKYLLSIEDLVSAFRKKEETSENISDNSWNYHFQIYRKDAIRGLRIRAKDQG
ncbi:hypothetical protein BB560_002590 [Smittium megazygosporum]|uniref:Uncharacterized protein n=1 Tax=Smittium megazygosporum TaxID=133381 RepID=A0A2T9XWP5_9FUNG|nr:hypothetical protein BB560_007347 [Smittium megazygosporum]PVV02945.1 hypothetical protein BB560_002590 [Smittium megazygosporum]